MESNLIKAKNILQDNNYTCVFYNGSDLHTSFDRGVKPLLDLLNKDFDSTGFVVADKVIGKAAAFLYVLLKVKTIYAIVISESAVNVLKQYGIEIHYDCLVPRIKNRTNTGFCPMESAVQGIDDPMEAKNKIIETIIELKKHKN